MKTPTWKKKVTIAEKVIAADDPKETSWELGKMHGLTPRQVLSIGAQRRIHIRKALENILTMNKGKSRRADGTAEFGDALLSDGDVASAIGEYAKTDAYEKLIAIGEVFGDTDYDLARLAYEAAGAMEQLLVMQQRLRTKEDDPKTADDVLDVAVKLGKKRLSSI